MFFHLYIKGSDLSRSAIQWQYNREGDVMYFFYVFLQSNLSWSKHVNHISLKVSKTIGILHRLESVYPIKLLLTLYNTLMLPYFNYCILSWGSVLKNNHHLHLHVLQKKAIRIITDRHCIAHTEPLLKELGLLKITNIFSLAI